MDRIGPGIGRGIGQHEIERRRKVKIWLREKGGGHWGRERKNKLGKGNRDSKPKGSSKVIKLKSGIPIFKDLEPEANYLMSLLSYWFFLALLFSK